ncbi:zinc finger domain-containing protein [Nocardioides nanhaiensis]|uniref:DNA-binding phage zinc finger domain-containing protein n=1 Tax=Nocardioides nanhaiensis TaxID=1476871 RepID=A0ABP8X0K9_9ACTN
MKPLEMSNHTTVPCPACGAPTSQACDRPRTCTDRIWRAINAWWLGYRAETLAVPCPVTACRAPINQPCINVRRGDYHELRLKAASAARGGVR